MRGRVPRCLPRRLTEGEGVGGARPSGRPPIWLAVLVLVVGGGVVAVAVRGPSSEKPGEAAESGEHPGAEHEAAAFAGGREGGEGERESELGGPNAEQVANRAYPRAYGDDRRALAERRAFDRVPGAAARSAFRGPADFRAALEAAPDRW